MNTYTLYEPETGRITGHVAGVQPPDEPHLEGHYDSETYLVKREQACTVERPPLVVSPNRIEGIPAGAEVIWGGAETDRAVVMDGVVEFDLVASQRLFVTVAVPNKPLYTLEVTA